METSFPICLELNFDVEVLVHSDLLLYLLYFTSFDQVCKIFPLGNHNQLLTVHIVLHFKDVFLVVPPVFLKLNRYCWSTLFF